MIDLLFLHGFYSSPKSRKYQHFLKVFPETKIGDYIGEYNVIDLYPTKKDFENMTVSKLVDEVCQKIERLDNDYILVGSSHGGLLSLAVQKQNIGSLRGIILMAPAIEFYKKVSNQFNIPKWKERGYLSLNYDRFKGTSKLSSEYILDLKNYREWPSVNLPILLVHGKQDDTIPVQTSIDYAKKQPNITEYYPAEGVHNLSNVIQQLTSVIVAWLSEKILNLN